MARLTLEDLRIAAPCGADWDAMEGDDRARHCAECRLTVYDLSAMTRAEAEALITEREGDVCVRFWQRSDGRVLTQDCPSGVRRRRRRSRALAATAALAIGAGATLTSSCLMGAPMRPRSTTSAPSTPSVDGGVVDGGEK